MSNAIVAEKIVVSDQETLFLLSDEYCKTFVRYVGDEMQSWDRVWFDLLSQDGFADVLEDTKYDCGERIVELDHNHLPQIRESQTEANYLFYIA